jgi:hypothetical protein
MSATRPRIVYAISVTLSKLPWTPSRIALVVTGSLLLLALRSAPADSCDCVRPRPLSPSVRTESPFILEGKVVEIVERSLHTTRTTSGGGSGEVQSLGREVVFEVRRAWNGVTTGRMAVSAEIGDCMFPFEIDHTYVVFAGKNAKGAPTTSICTRTVESNKAADVLAQLGPAAAPK